MLKPKTHFEQVPLDVVEKILKAADGGKGTKPVRAIAEQKLEAQEPVAGTLAGRRKNLSLDRGKQVRC